ncbi:MAG: hypothetical protein KBS52_00290 [Clostridiales bacterium]|nr:hypothetical protein [Candidatus Equinaster intestinalis]
MKIVGVLALSKFGFDWRVIVVMNIVSLLPLAIAQHFDISKRINQLKNETNQ